jgi:hypothetical protein
VLGIRKREQQADRNRFWFDCPQLFAEVVEMPFGGGLEDTALRIDTLFDSKTPVRRYQRLNPVEKKS